MLVQYIGNIVKKIPKTIKLLKKNKFQAIAVTSTTGLAVSEIGRKKERDEYKRKFKMYQELLKKHQAEIDALKSDREREEYKKKLIEEYELSGGNKE